MPERKLTADIVARTARFERGMQRSQKAVDDLGNRTTRFGGVAAAGFAVAGAAVLAFAVKMGRALAEQSQLIDGQAKLSRALGLGVDQLRTLTAVAGEAGVSQQQLEVSMRNLTRRVGEAAVVGGRVSEVFERLGLDVAKLGELSTQEQLFAVADAIRQIENPSLQATAAFDLLGRSGVEMLNVLNQGSDALREQQREQLLLIGSMNDSAASIERMNDMMARLKSVWDSFKGVILSVIAVPLADWLDRINQTLALSRILAENASVVWTGVAKIGEAIVRGEFGEIDDILAATAVQIAAITALENAAALSTSTFTAAIVEQSKAVEELGEKLKEIDPDEALGERIRRSVRTAEEIFRDTIIELDRLLEKGFIDPETYRRAAERARKELERALEKPVEAEVEVTRNLTSRQGRLSEFVRTVAAIPLVKIEGQREQLQLLGEIVRAVREPVAIRWS